MGRTGSSACQVAMLERYYSMAALPKQSKLRLFPGIVVTKSGERLRSQLRLPELHSFEGVVFG